MDQPAYHLRSSLTRRRALLYVGLWFVFCYFVILLAVVVTGAPAWASRGFAAQIVGLLAVGVMGMVLLAYAWREAARDRRIVEQLDESEARLRLLTAQMPGNVWTTDRELRLTSVFGTLIPRLENPALREVGHTLYEIFGTQDDTHPTIAAHRRALQGESAAYERTAGEMVIEGRVEPLRDARGRVIGCVGAMMDVSTWRWAEAQVRRFAAAIESSIDAVITTSLDGTIETWNPSAERLFGYPSAEVKGRSIGTILMPGREAEYQRNLETLRRGVSVGPYEAVRVRADGTTMAVAVTLSPIRSANGAVIGASGIVRDVTAMKRARETIEHLASFPEMNPMPIVEFDAAGHATYANAAAERLLPTLREGTGSHPFVDEVPALVEAMRRAGKSRQWRELQAEDVWYALDMYVLPDYSRLRIYAVDVTEQRRVVEALRESEQRFRRVLDGMRLIGLSLDRNGTVTYCNNYLVELIGSSRADVFGKDWFLAFVPSGEPVRARFALAMETGELPVHDVHDVRTRDGGRRTIHWNNTLLRDADGRVEGVVSIGEDISERIEADEQLRRSQEELRALARHLHTAREEEDTRMSREIHDQLGQALTVLRLDLSWLGKKLPDSGAAVRRKIGAMVAMVDETIELVRQIASELRPPILDDLGLMPALEWYVARFAGRTGLRHELHAGTKELSADRDLLVVAYRIVQEALTNVARHAQAERFVVSVDERDGMLMLEVRDDGRGIEATTARSPRSLGIVGMRERAAVRGGTVEVGPSPEGGTAVRVAIPLERRRAPRASA